MRKLQFVKLTAIAVALLSTIDASAVSVRAKMKIFSSGPDIYVCNAGVATHTAKKACYFSGIVKPGNECTDTSCATAKGVCDSPCICNDAIGSKFVNAMVASSAPYTYSDNLTPAPGVPVGKLTADTSKFVEVHPDQTTVWNYKVSDVGSVFTSENYTASAFIDICYRGTQLQDYGGQIQITSGVSAVPFTFPNPTKNLPLDRNRTGLNMGEGNYLSLSGLTYQTFAVCGNTMSDTVFQVNSDGIPVPGGPNYIELKEQSITQSETLVPVGNAIIEPHFCKVRYILRETSYLNAFAPRRVNRAEGGEICTFTDIVDPTAKQNSTTPIN